ncbi:MAG: sigma-54-dependent Fis family transcriptional regulator [Planctomycetota bacterium]|nr:sigma-54-dependent Fis family transcriptional regulator [Planctomycetota bacterium]
MALKILLVDDERTIRTTLGDDLFDVGHTVVRCENHAQALEALDHQSFDILVTDLNLPDGSGMDLLPVARKHNPDVSLLVITAHQTIDTAINATKIGADYLVKPFLNEEVLARLAKIEEVRKLKDEIEALKTQVTGRFKIDRIVGKSTRMQELYQMIETIGPSDATVLIRGESGTGKELVAQAIHRNSPRCDKRLIKLSCAALPDNLLEDELFGHEKGAFTDAKERKLGRFELAHGGSIFLDDIDDMSISTQVKLLRVLQEREFERIGGTKTIKVDVRVIVASKVDLSMLVRQARFRDDLYFRLHVVELNLPSLRERLEDLPLLVEHFTRVHGGGRRYIVDEETLHEMCQYAWPGNIRELENSVMRSIAMSGKSEKLDRRYLLQTPAAMRPDAAGAPVAGMTMLSQGYVPPPAPAGPGPTLGAPSPAPAALPAAVLPHPNVTGLDPFTFRPLRDVVHDAEKAYIQRVLDYTRGNRTKAAEVLGISRKNLWEKMKELEIT